MRLSASYRFAAAMRLPEYDGQCAEFHGYDFHLTVSAAVPLPGHGGFELDLQFVDQQVQEKVVKPMADTLLNLLLEEPSLENCALWIARVLTPAIPGLSTVKLAAGPRYSVELDMTELEQV